MSESFSMLCSMTTPDVLDMQQSICLVQLSGDALHKRQDVIVDRECAHA